MRGIIKWHSVTSAAALMTIMQKFWIIPKAWKMRVMKSIKSGERSRRVMNPIAITTGMPTYRRIIKCLKVMSAYANVVLATS